MKLPIQSEPVMRKASTAKIGILLGITASIPVNAGPIWSNDDAQGKCPATCAALGRAWNGQWRTIIWGHDSVCYCD